MERSAFLERVRLHLGSPTEVALPDSWPDTPATGRTADAETFQAALARNNGLARLVSVADLAEAVADEAREVSARRAVIAPDVDDYREHIDRGLEDAAVEGVRPVGAEWRTAAASADLGITSARLAVAATGSILIVPGPSSPRVASLLPPAHLAIVPADRLVGGLEDVMLVLSELADRSSAPVLITGPSRTSDIEMTTVYGVHGPK